MSKLRIIEVTKYFPDGHTEKTESQVRTSEVTAPWFEVDNDYYFWPVGTQLGTEVLYRPARHLYTKMTAVGR
jgi:hypothetical protein